MVVACALLAVMLAFGSAPALAQEAEEETGQPTEAAGRKSTDSLGGQSLESAANDAKNGVLRLVSPLEARNGPDPEPQGSPSRTFRTLDEVQRDHILEVLASCDGQIAGRGGAAQVLGIHPNTLRSRLKKLGISTPK
jgi:transcriptional regulator with GAF, ATPase, and Fis domain